MKFATKVFFCVLVLVLLGFDVMGYWLTQRSYQLNQDYTVEASMTEFSVVSSSVYKSILLAQEQFSELNAENVKLALAPYASFYAQQKVYFALYNEGELVYSGMPGGAVPPDSLASEQGSTVGIETVGDTSYLFIQDKEDTPLAGMRFVYIKDVQSLADFRTEMASSFAWASIAVGAVLTILLVIMLANLTRSLRKLNAAASEISQGNYEKRVDVRGKDEVADFAQSFNAMTERVGDHIQGLSRMAEEKEQFIENLSHELRTPTTAILGYAEVLQIGNCSEQERKQATDYLIEQSRRLKGLSAKLMDLTYVTNTEVDNSSVDLEKVLCHVEDTLTQQLEQKGVELTRNATSSHVYGDASLIESLFQNLMENAIRASHAGSVVELRTTACEEGVTVAVIDHGDGMIASEVEKVSEPFYRIDKARSRANGGVGLGLTLCARICEMQGAQMEIYSTPGEGTKVEIHFTTLRHSYDGSEIQPCYDDAVPGRKIDRRNK